MPDYVIVLAGQLGVGKSSIFTRLKNGIFSEDSGEQVGTLPRSGLENFIYDTQLNGRPVKVTLWDTGGLERFESMTANYYRFCHAVILVYDTDREATLYALREWVHEARRFSRWRETITFSLWGNKTDSTDSSKDEFGVESILLEFGIPASLHFKVSAKTGENLDSAFQTVIKAVDEKYSNTNKLEISDDAHDMALLTASLPAPRNQTRIGSLIKCCRQS